MNTYEPTDVTYHGGMKHGANIHAVSMQVNQYVWDMIKILNKNDLYGFDFQAQIGIKRTVVILRHEDREMISEARKLLRGCHTESNFVFLAKIKEPESTKILWIMLAILTAVAILGWSIFFVSEKDVIFSSFDYHEFPTEMLDSESLITQKVEIDIEKLKAFKDAFLEQNNSSPSISEPMMKAMEMTTSVISSLVSEEEKSKYNSKNLVKNFKGKSGIEFVLKDGNLSKDFKATVKDLNSYAKRFIEDDNISLALACYDKALENEMNRTKDSEILITLVNQSELYDAIGEPIEAEKAYQKILDLSQKLVKKDFMKYAFTQAWSLTKLININSGKNLTLLHNEALEKVEKIYKMLLIEFRKKASNKKRIHQVRLAWALNFLADFYANEKEEILISIEMRKEAIAIYKKLRKRGARKFLFDYYKTLNSLAKNYLDINDVILANKIYKKSLEISLKLSKMNKKYAGYQGLSLSALGQVEVARESFDRAEHYYRDALKVYKKLAHKNSKKYAVNLIEMEGLFAGLDVKRGNFELAQQRYKKVILSYKMMNKQKPLAYNLSIARELNHFTSLKFHFLKDYLGAEIKAFEAISFCETAKRIEYKEAKYLQAESYRYLAYLATLEHNMPTAWDYYQKARAIVKGKPAK